MLLTQASFGPEGVDACVACHPSFLKIPEEVAVVEKPTLMLVGDADQMLPMQEVKSIQEIFAGKQNCFVEVFQGQVHGFAVRGDLSVEKDRQAKEAAATKVRQMRS
jgi:dienelactone hydrolase